MSKQLFLHIPLIGLVNCLMLKKKKKKSSDALLDTGYWTTASLTNDPGEFIAGETTDNRQLSVGGLRTGQWHNYKLNCTDPFFVKAALDMPSDPSTNGFLQQLWGISSLNFGWNHGGNSVEIGNSLYFSCHFQFACERGSEKAKAEFNLGKKRSARRPQWEPLLLWFKDDCILYYLFVCIAYLLRILIHFYMETFHSAALIKKKKLHWDPTWISSWVSSNAGLRTFRYIHAKKLIAISRFSDFPRQRDKFPEFPVKRSLMSQKYSATGGNLKALTGIRRWAGAEEVGAERLLLDERSWMIIEHTAGPEMINAILLFHLLFINSLSAIMARAQMKGEGGEEKFRLGIIRANEDGAREWEVGRWREGR